MLIFYVLAGIVLMFLIQSSKYKKFVPTIVPKYNPIRCGGSLPSILPMTTTKSYDLFEEDGKLQKTTKAVYLGYGQVKHLKVFLPVQSKESELQDKKESNKTLPGLDLGEPKTNEGTPLLKIDVLVNSHGQYKSVLTQPLIITSETEASTVLDFSNYLNSKYLGQTLFLQREYLTSGGCPNLIHLECDIHDTMNSKHIMSF